MTIEVDPEASLGLWELDLELGGRHFTVPALPASEWLSIVLSGNPLSVLDTLVSTSENDVDTLLLTGQVTEDELTERCLEAISEVAGRPFAATFILLYAAKLSWPAVNGRLTLAGFRWDERPLGAALDAIYALLVENMGKDDRAKFLALLESPLPGVAGAKPDTAKMEQDFESIAGPKPTTGVRATGGPSDSARSRTRTPRQQPLPGAESAEPKPRPAGRARSGPVAKSARRAPGAARASGTVPPPLPRAPRPRPARSDGSGAGRGSKR